MIITRCGYGRRDYRNFLPVPLVISRLCLTFDNLMIVFQPQLFLSLCLADTHVATRQLAAVSQRKTISQVRCPSLSTSARFIPCGSKASPPFDMCAMPLCQCLHQPLQSPVTHAHFWRYLTWIWLPVLENYSNLRFLYYLYMNTFCTVCCRTPLDQSVW